MSADSQVRKRWGAGYYEELRKFHDQHEGASAIEYHNDLKVPVRAIYYFAPYQCYVEGIQLRAAIAESNLKDEDQS